MGINIGICENEAEHALCREYRAEIVKVHVKDISGLEDLAEYDTLVELKKAKEIMKDWNAFVKRNRLNEEADAVYLDKVKKEDDLEALTPFSRKVCTGWIVMSNVPDGRREEVLSRAAGDDIVSGWDLLDFDGMNEICGKCPLSWDKGRGCIGAFGPNNSKLPEIAAKYNCPITASVFESVRSKRIFGPEDAKALLAETEILKDALPKEGKVYVNRYSGPVERMEAVAKISVAENCGWFFF